MLRKAGDFPNKTIVEYATITVKLPNYALPKNLQLLDGGQCENSVIYVGVSPRGRLSRVGCCIESLELAEQFAERIKGIFEKRSYKDLYTLDIEVLTSSCTKMTTKYKQRDSDAIRAFLNS